MIKLIIYARDSEKHGPAAAKGVVSLARLAPPRHLISSKGASLRDC
jgi:hypothetical protein